MVNYEAQKIALEMFDIEDTRDSPRDTAGVVYPLSDEDHYVEVYVRDYDAEATLDELDVYTALQVWLMNRGLDKLCIFAESSTVSSVYPPNEFESEVEHHDYGTIELDIGMKYHRSGAKAEA